MKDNNSNTDLIEKYLNNELSESEKVAFDSRLAEDKALAQEFEKHQLAHKALDYVIAKNLKKQLIELEEEEKIVSLNIRKNKRLMIISLAASLLLVAGFFFFIQSDGRLDGAALAGNYYEAPNLNIRSSGESSQFPALIEEGRQALNDKDYGKAIEAFSSIASEDDYYIQAQFMLGHAYFQQKNYAAAIPPFDIVNNSEDFRLEEAAEWFALLACIAQNLDCKERLEQILNQKTHAFYEKTVSLNNKMK